MRETVLLTGASGFLGTLLASRLSAMPGVKVYALVRASSLAQNLYVADATILPQSLGNPPILTIMALALKIADVIESQDF